MLKSRMCSFAIAVLTLSGILFVHPSPASAAGCDSDTRYHVRLAYELYKDWQTYLDEDNDAMAHAQFSNLQHELDRARDGITNNCSNDIGVSRVFFLMSAHVDMSKITVALAEGDHDLISNTLDLERSDLVILFSDGGAKTNPADYVVLKQALRDACKQAGVPFKPWEKTGI